MNVCAIPPNAAPAVAEYSCPQEILLDLEVSNRWEALRDVSALIERSRGLGAAPIFRALWRREQAASTGLGGGFALPHARITGIKEPVTAYVRTKTPIGFAAPDHRSVSELFVLLVPADADNAKHLELLARIAEMFADSAFRVGLLQAHDAASIREIFRSWLDQRSARLRVTPA